MSDKINEVQYKCDYQRAKRRGWEDVVLLLLLLWLYSSVGARNIG
jgi:hypothetical protein